VLASHLALPQPMIPWVRPRSELELVRQGPAGEAASQGHGAAAGPSGAAPADLGTSAGPVRGLEAELEALVRRHYRSVQALLRRLIGPRPEAQDLVQETFLRARGRVPEGEAAAAAYLRRIATNLAAGWWRAQGRTDQRLELPESVLSNDPGPAAQLAQAELEDSLRVAIAALPERCRLAFVARVLEGLEYPAVAAGLGVAEATARQQVMEARQRLARALKPFLDTDDQRSGAS
jgi:RNA polymerase sigma-70 factor, ECF subfamily